MTKDYIAPTDQTQAPAQAVAKPATPKAAATPKVAKAPKAEKAPAVNRGGRPRKKIDVQALLAEPEVQDVLKQITSLALAEALGNRPAVASPAEPLADGAPDWVNRLAVALGQVADPRKKPLDPAVINARQEARERMHALIDEAARRGLVPEYELLREVYLEEQLISATYVGADRVLRRTKIGWTKVPGQAMVPVNEVAAAIHREYLLSVGGIVTEGKVADAEPGVGGSLRLYQDGKLQTVKVSRSPIGNAGSLSIRNQGSAGAIVETAVLGTVAQPARQLA